MNTPEITQKLRAVSPVPGRGFTPAEISRLTGIPRQTISCIEAKALRKVRRLLRSHLVELDLA